MDVTRTMNALVVGGGMYVIGRGTDSFGTILPALFEARREGRIGKIAVATTRAATSGALRDRAHELGHRMGVDGECETYPAEGTDPRAYLTACEADLAVISVPDHLHAEVAIPILERRIPCLLVKPMAPTVAEARAIAEAAERAGVIGQVEFHKRLDESNLLLRDKVAGGELGSLLYAVVEYSQRKTIPQEAFRSWSARTNIFQYLGVHYVDLIQFVTRFRPRRVTAWGEKEHLASLGIDTWDAIQAVIEWEKPDGQTFVSAIVTNWIDPAGSSAMSDQKINVVGTAGRYQADQKNRGIQIVRDEAGIEDVNPYFSAAWVDPSTQTLRFHGYGIRSVNQFIGDVLAWKEDRITPEQLETIRPTFRAALTSTAVIEAAERSLAGGSKPVDITP